MKAIVLCPGNPDPVLTQQEVPAPTPGPGQAVVTLRAAALNRRDVWIRLGRYAGIRLPATLGSDGAGEVTAVGEGVSQDLLSRKVVILPSLDWGPDQAVPGPSFRILGMPDPGTFAEQVCVPAENLFDMPPHLSFEEAAALPLAGLTGYRALCTRGRLRPGETVLVPGIGGGVSTLVVMMAVHLGARVVVTSSSPDKLRRAQDELGVAFGVDHTQADWDRQLLRLCGDRPPDLAVDGAGGDTFARCLNAVRPGGRVVSYGATGGAAPFEVRRLFWKQLDVLGTTMGSPSDFAGMLALVRAGKLRPPIDTVVPLSQAGEALVRMENSRHMGKIVLTMG